MAPWHILIVGYEPNTAEMLTSYFEAQGYEITTVSWGEEALALSKKVLPDLVMLDIRLPDIDGYEVCRQLRNHRRTARVPIILLTDEQGRVDRLAALELGAIDYVTKPFDLQELKLRVRNVLRRADTRPLVHPVTGLPLSALVDEQLSGLLGKEQRAVVAVALDELEAFADTYGFVVRDDVLRAVALMIRNIVDEEGGEEPFVGQLTDTVLFLVTTPDCAQRVRDRLEARLKEALVFFYPRVDWETGQDQAGNPVPRLSVRLGMVATPGSYQGLGELREAILNSLTPSQ